MRVREKAGNLTGQLSEETPWLQLDDLTLCQSALPRSLRKFSEVREKSGKIKVEKSGYAIRETLH